jgi:hypothetical protein
VRALFVIASDPRTSHRPAEAVRIAAGVAAWKKVDVSLYLHGEAALILDETAGSFVDEEHIERYLPMLDREKIYVKDFAKIAREHSVVTWF